MCQFIAIFQDDLVKRLYKLHEQKVKITFTQKSVKWVSIVGY